MSKMLFPKMAVSNIRKNKKLYVPYIITAIFTVMMFFMNISIVKNKNVAAMRGGQNVVVLLQVWYYIQQAYVSCAYEAD